MGTTELEYRFEQDRMEEDEEELVFIVGIHVVFDGVIRRKFCPGVGQHGGERIGRSFWVFPGGLRLEEVKLQIQIQIQFPASYLLQFGNAQLVE